MKKKLLFISCMSLFLMVLAACGGGGSSKEGGMAPGSNVESAKAEKNGPAAGTKTIHYLGETYTVPQKVEKIVITGAMEAMEDALVLDVHPTGAISIGGQFPAMFASITDRSESIGEKTQPNFEKILQLSPDVIIGTTKFPSEAVSKLQKIAPTILVSHISTNWESNLKLMAELTGKQAKAEQILTQYKADSKAAQAQLKEKLQGKTVVALRVRAGKDYVYPKDVFFNPVLYGEIGLDVPKQIEQAKAQEAISVEALAEMNPDHIFLQFSTNENKGTENALEELKKNPVLQSTNAFKNNQVYVNVVDPLMEGGPAYSRIKFLESVQRSIEK